MKLEHADISRLSALLAINNSCNCHKFLRIFGKTLEVFVSVIKQVGEQKQKGCYIS